MFTHLNPWLNRLSNLLTERQQTVSCAESCTGGLLAAALTERSGSSAFFKYGFVSYANEAKQQLLGVNPQTLQENGAVSEQTVTEMAKGALHIAGADFALSISGIAGPTGGSIEKPVGTVWFGLANTHGVFTKKCQFSGSRSEIRQQATEYALIWLCHHLEQNPLKQ